MGIAIPIRGAVICIQEIRRMNNYFKTNIIECEKSTLGDKVKSVV